MAQIRVPDPVKLFVGVLTSLPSLLPEIEEELVSRFGAVDFRSGQLLFDFTDYYDSEMGTPIYRFFLSFARLIEPSEIAGIKVATNGIEGAFAEKHVEVPRPVNLDPGYLEQSKIVLASTKNFFHRILVSGGIYAEVTLHFQEGEWRAFPWSFPDYKSTAYQEFFSAIRKLYRTQLRCRG